MFDKSKAPKCHDCKKYPAKNVEKHGKKILSLCDDCSFVRNTNANVDAEINKVLFASGPEEYCEGW